MSFHINWVGLIEVMANSLDRARCWRDNGVFFGITGLSMSVFNAAIIEDNAALTADRFPDLMRPLEVLGLPYSVQVASPFRDPPFEPLFTRAGYVEMLCDPLMVCEGALTLPALNPALCVTTVSDEQGREAYKRVFSKGFDMTLPTAQGFIEIMLSLPESLHVVAWLGGAPVGIGSLVCAGGVAGVYNVATTPEARRQGVAVAVMNALHNHALTVGYPGTALASSEMGLPLYQRLGYRADGFQYAYVPLGVPV